MYWIEQFINGVALTVERCSEQNTLQLNLFLLPGIVDVAHGLDLAYPGHAAAYRGNIDVLHTLLDRGQIRINDRDNRGATLTHKGVADMYAIMHRAILVMISSNSLGVTTRVQ